MVDTHLSGLWIKYYFYSNFLAPQGITPSFYVISASSPASFFAKRSPTLYTSPLIEHAQSMIKMADSMEKKELDRQYSPSMWSKRLPPGKIVDNHLKHFAEGRSSG